MPCLTERSGQKNTSRCLKVVLGSFRYLHYLCETAFRWSKSISVRWQKVLRYDFILETHSKMEISTLQTGWIPLINGIKNLWRILPQISLELPIVNILYGMKLVRSWQVGWLTDKDNKTWKNTISLIRNYCEMGIWGSIFHDTPLPPTKYISIVYLKRWSILLHMPYLHSWPLTVVMYFVKEEP